MMKQNTIQKFINADTLANEIMQRSQSYKENFLLTEGGDDVRLFEKFTNHDYCNIVDANGKKNVIGAIKVLQGRGFFKAIGIIDDDHDKLLGNVSKHQNLFYTDENDLEMMLLKSKALDDYCNERIDQEKVKNCTELKNSSIINFILLRAKYKGAARLVSRKLNWEIDFHQISRSWLNQKDLSFDFLELYENIYNSNKEILINKNITKSVLIDEIKKTIEEIQDAWLLCRGHDATEILGISLQSLFANLGHERTKKEEVELGLRLAYHYEYFKQSSLYQSIHEWELVNSSVFR